MECNNKNCVFNAFDSCCHESEEGFSKAKPNRIDCPSSIRVDIQHQLVELQVEILTLTERRNMKELIEIKKFILNQRGKENA